MGTVDAAARGSAAQEAHSDDGSHHAAGFGRSLPGTIKGRTVSDTGANDGQAECNIHGPMHSQHLTTAF